MSKRAHRLSSEIKSPQPGAALDRAIAAAESEQAERAKAPCPASFGQRDTRDEPAAEFGRGSTQCLSLASHLRSAFRHHCL